MWNQHDTSNAKEHLMNTFSWHYYIDISVRSVLTDFRMFSNRNFVTRRHINRFLGCQKYWRNRNYMVCRRWIAFAIVAAVLYFAFSMVLAAPFYYDKVDVIASINPMPKFSIRPLRPYTIQYTCTLISYSMFGRASSWWWKRVEEGKLKGTR